MHDNTLYRQEILDKPRLKLLPQLRSCINALDSQFNTERYLAWWTAVALYYGHRMSEDFDFFTATSFDEVALAQQIWSYLPDATIIHQAPQTLYLLINGIKVSFFNFPYHLIDSLTQTDYFPIAWLHDLGCMKLQAIQWRATRKDYVDLYYLLNNLWFWSLYEQYCKKYPTPIQDALLLKYCNHTHDVSATPVIFLQKEQNRHAIQAWLNEYVSNYEATV